MRNRIQEVVTIVDIEIDILQKGMKIYIDKMPDKLDVINDYYKRIEDLRFVKRHLKSLIEKYEASTKLPD